MKKVNALILSSKDIANNVYTKELQDQINEFLNLYPQIVKCEDLPALACELQDVEFVFSTWGLKSFTEEEIGSYLPKLKYLMYGAGSVQAFCRPFMSKGVRIFSAYGANAVSVAQYAAPQILLATKGYFQSVRMYRNIGHKVAKDYGSKMPGNFNVKIAILGAGMTGRGVMDQLQGKDVSFIVYDPYVSDEVLAKYNATRVSLEEAFKQALVISCHIADRPDNRGMLKYEHFASMQDNATFVNTGRGAQVVEDDLIRALKENETLTALLDVTYPEPASPDSELFKMENVFLTPHLAGANGGEVARLGQEMIVQAKNIVENKQVSYEILESMLATMA